MYANTATLSERQRHVLATITQHFITTAEPVASKTLVEEYRLGVSSATIRNVMGELEEMGFLSQPHTSAGRIPTEQAYRHYVNELLLSSLRTHGHSLLDAQEQRRILTRYEQMTLEQWEDLFLFTSQLLAQLSQYVGIVVSGQLQESVLERLELVALSANQLLVVLILNPGVVKQRIFSLESQCSASQLFALGRLLNERLSGRTLREIRAFALQVGTLYDLFEGEYQTLAMEMTRQIFLHDGYGSKVYWDGLRNVVMQPEFANAERARTVYRTLESRERLLDLFGSLEPFPEGGVRVVIGTEIPGSGMEQCSLITATYRVTGGAAGMVGVMGPMRMEYLRLIPLVGFTAELMTHYFENST